MKDWWDSGGGKKKKADLLTIYRRYIRFPVIKSSEVTLHTAACKFSLNKDDIHYVWPPKQHFPVIYSYLF